jgi:hypothetical protein
MAIASRGYRRGLSGRTRRGFSEKARGGGSRRTGSLSLPEFVGLRRNSKRGSGWALRFAGEARAPLHFQPWAPESTAGEGLPNNFAVTNAGALPLVASAGPPICPGACVSE